jgi:uncharacterized protein (TIGR04255 family)
MPPYKRPPIAEAVIEVRIGNPISMDLVGRVRDRLLEFYPPPVQSVMQTNFAIGIGAPTIQEQTLGYRLNSGDGAGLVTIGQQYISTSKLPPYEGWEPFVATARRNWDTWKDRVGWQKIARVGVRYVNRIDIPIESEHGINIDDYLTFSIKGPALALPPLASFAINEVRPLGIDDCQLTLNAGLVPSPLIKTMSLLLDVDVSRMTDIPQGDESLWAFVDRMRTHKNFIFEGCITDRARELFNR